MKLNGIPPKQGLYDPQFEHDACGMGFVVNIKGVKSHQIVQQALTILVNLSHRGGCGAEANSGDGAGILIQIPHLFFKKECLKAGIDLPSPGEYGVGMVFLPSDANKRSAIEKLFERIVKEEGQNFLGWRDVPVDDSSVGASAKACMPFMRQAFIGRSPNLKDSMAFERKLYVIRKLCEKSAIDNNEHFYIASLSSKTIVYKGMLTAEQVDSFYTELADASVESALALVHSRYSTNTFPSWERAHPNRYLIHNGEINTLRGNVNWMSARQSMLKSDLFGDDISKIFPIINPDGSDSAMFDNCTEFLALAGRSLPHAVMMMIPEPWSNHESMSDEKKAFYEYHSCLMEPWDGPAAMGFTDGSVVGAVLDRNGLRPARYYVTKDDLVIMASEVGVLDIEPERVLCKERLHPGRMLLIDTVEGKIINDDELKEKMSAQHPYRQWLNENLITLEDLPTAPQMDEPDYNTTIIRQKAFGYTYEDLKTVLGPMAKDGIEQIGAMGIDTPLSVLSEKPQLLYTYFKQLFAQVTNPPIDALREEIITATETMMGSEGDLLTPSPQSCRQIKLKYPVIDNGEMSKILNIDKDGFKTCRIPMLFKVSEGENGLAAALEDIFKSASESISQGSNILVLSDKGMNKDYAPIPALLAVSGLHHHLIREGTRTRISIVVETGEAREVHHFALLIGYGASAINPYLAFESIESMISQGMLTDIKPDYAIGKYIKASVKGVVKTLSKMGISTIQSYQGAQIFEAIGIRQEVIDRYFTKTPSRIGGIDLTIIANEAIKLHSSAFSSHVAEEGTLDSGGNTQWRKDGEYHMFNPETIHTLQYACRTNNYGLFKEYSRLLNNESQKLCTLRGLMELKTLENPIPIDEVESVESICKRFKTGAMSYGSISKEAHEAMAIAMNRIGGKSNTGEGGEDVSRFTPDSNGDSRCSAIKQVASGRFGVTSHYLVNAKEIQIKMAQGAKPGEGGQLPGRKVYPWVAKVRHSTPGVGLISPPPHHDIYSIEDLAELIHDLKNANRDARISVKLVSEVGVGTIAAGVAKGRADVVLISGYDGGTGASPRSSIRHAGLPWELGLAETHQTLILNNLRSRITVETDGKLMTGRDVVVAALLGAEEFGFATTPLVVLGCVMMRVCNLDTCPVGVATQNPELRKRFSGDPQHLVNFMHFVAQEMRELMAELGFRSIDEMIGRTDKLEARKIEDHWKASGIDLSPLLYQPHVSADIGRYCQIEQDHELDKTLDMKELLKICKPALENAEKVTATLPIKNINRVACTILGSEVSKRYGGDGLPEDTISLTFKGSAGQSFGAFVPKGITMTLEGDSNDYIGKGLSGGKIIVYPPKESPFVPEENIIVGNVAFYGATSGEAYIRGIAGERFCVRNSGVHAVVEAVGDHGCEYMTGGKVLVLGSTGRNFAAGMSGGVAYVLNRTGDFSTKCNQEMVSLESLEDTEEILEVKAMLERHLKYTGSGLADRILSEWHKTVPLFVKVMPKDYKRMLQAIKQMQDAGLSGQDALMAAFEANNKDVARVGGN
ncbi:glutamate synthase (ferredoxin) [Anaerobacterium chartisolvens]|uniref:Glutamate synthase (Ferredoxin) n=1 Tax=Anaerobacterium chartisolvens TaxID=1297424 RepID=A0A369B3D9_9FIRM|nr:glutamate synthase large subunit [Anaerobacterium chartisolvens]RCX16100.1 glutamate synthase (ferredoxin) [Anaerobacterium chartisolvens]